MNSASERTRRRGQPVVALALLLGGWFGLRALLWESPFPDTTTVSQWRRATSPSWAELSDQVSDGGEGAKIANERDNYPARVSDVREPANRLADGSSQHPVGSNSDRSIHSFPERDDHLPRSGGEALLPGTGDDEGRDGTSHSSRDVARVAAKRWRIDAWGVWRPDSALPRVAAGGPLALAYGGTQVGVLGQFDLTRGAHPARLFVRATHAPGRPAQSDLAVGISARPIARAPARLFAEVRATRSINGVEVRPAVYAVSEFQPLVLPGGILAEGYLQAGWVGGRYKTGFVDGQGRLDREIMQIGRSQLRAGAGAWGGAQKFVRRIDVGPSLTLDMRDSGVPARLSLDYRIRVAGNARPGNGVALTLSTGF